MLVKVDGSPGMLVYATAEPPYYVTFRGAGGSPRCGVPARVVGCYQRERKVLVVGYGAVRVERVTGHYRERVES